MKSKEDLLSEILTEIKKIRVRLKNSTDIEDKIMYEYATMKLIWVMKIIQEE